MPEITDLEISINAAITKLTAGALTDLQWATAKIRQKNVPVEITDLANAIIEKNITLESIISKWNNKGNKQIDAQYLKFVNDQLSSGLHHSEVAKNLQAKIIEDLKWPCKFGQVKLKENEILKNNGTPPVPRTLH